MLLGVSSAAGQDRLSPEEAMRLMTLDERMQEAEAEALAEDPAYQRAKAAADEAQRAWTEHREAFEARRDADPDYRAAQQQVVGLESRVHELQQQRSQLMRERREATNTIRTARTDIARVRRGIASLERDRQKYQSRHDQLLKSWKEGDEDDAGTNSSGTRFNSLAHLQDKIDDLAARIEEGRLAIGAAESKIAEAEPVAESNTAELELINRELLEAKAALPGARQALTEAEAKWNGPFHASPTTQKLEAEASQAAKRLDSVRSVALERLRRGEGDYAKLYRQRVAIQAYKD
jgi:chromosome segregation ATPase